uniref:Uncharacterized protein n=1 Tax=Arion vulgaris TaxID=1028688 RepID=A0A0B7BXL2_9EUPU
MYKFNLVHHIGLHFAHHKFVVSTSSQFTISSTGQMVSIVSQIWCSHAISEMVKHSS